MVENNKSLTIAIIALLTSLGFGGTTLIDNPSALDNYFICDVNYEIGEFARLSSTKYSAYPNEFDNKGYRRCVENDVKGEWHQVLPFVEANNIDISTLIPSDDLEGIENTVDKPEYSENSNIAAKYVCNNEGCIKMEE